MTKKSQKPTVGIFEYRKLTDLKKLENNPRTIRDTAFKKLCESIIDNPEYFQARPIILSDRTGELIIIAGNQRFEAALSLKLKEVPTFLLPNLTEKKEREIIIRDNVNNGDWDFDKLANEWAPSELNAWGVDVPDDWEDEEEEEDMRGDGEETIEATIKLKCLASEKDDITDWLNIQFKKTAYKNIIIE